MRSGTSRSHSPQYTCRRADRSSPRIYSALNNVTRKFTAEGHRLVSENCKSTKTQNSLYGKGGMLSPNLLKSLYGGGGGSACQPNMSPNFQTLSQNLIFYWEGGAEHQPLVLTSSDSLGLTNKF